jgi:transcriptional regulator with XRE-family HTH domain
MTPKEIRSRRLALGISVDALARELRLPANEIREIEGGERPPDASRTVRANLRSTGARATTERHALSDLFVDRSPCLGPITPPSRDRQQRHP